MSSPKQDLTRPSRGGENQGSRLSFTKAVNQVFNLVLGVSETEWINPGPSQIATDEPGRALLTLARAMQSEAFEPENGFLNYRRLATSSTYAAFRECTRSLPSFHPGNLGNREHQIAFWINIYNALILDAIIHYQVRNSLLRDPGFFRRAAYLIGDHRYSADDIEHGILRGNRPHPLLPIPLFDKNDPRWLLRLSEPDPRVHFALVCGAQSCPPIAFYQGNRLDEQLEMAASSFVNGEGVDFDERSGTLRLSRIFRWYQRDFGGKQQVLAFIQERTTRPEVLRLLASEAPRIRYQKYDWSVNGWG